MNRLHVSLNDEQFANVKLLAGLMKCSPSEVIRRLLDSKEKEMVRAIRRLEKAGSAFL